MGVEVLVESPELTIKDPAHSALGRALQGLVMTQMEEEVRIGVWLSPDGCGYQLLGCGYHLMCVVITW